MKIEKFEDLEIWQNARELCKIIYILSQKEIFTNDYKFRAQIFNSAGSIMDNIAEGFERDGNKEFIQFLSIAKGSCGELRSQIYRAYDFSYLNQNDHKVLLQRTIEISKSISGLIKYLRSSKLKGRKYK